jgi:hypothetical protein
MAFTGSPLGTTNYQMYAGTGTTKAHAADEAGGLTIARWAQYTHAAGAGTGEINLIVLPPGRILIFPDLSRIVTTQFAASADLHLGFRAYTENDGDAVSEDDNAFLNDADAGGGALDSAWVLPAIGYQVFDTRGGLIIYAMVDAGNIEDNDTIDGWVAYTRAR